VTASSTASSNGTFWQPEAGITWQIDLASILNDTSFDADVFDIDLFDTPFSTIETLHSLGHKVICYFSAGTYENWRPDAAQFLASDQGNAVDGWQGEWWLDTSSASVRAIMTARMELALTKGCDGLDPDNVDGYESDTGFDLTQDRAVDYLTFLAEEAHSRGLAIGLKNAGDLVATILPIMQWEVNEQCVVYDECDLFRPFVDAGKPVFHIEYPKTAPGISNSVKIASCAGPDTSGFSSILKKSDLDDWIDVC